MGFDPIELVQAGIALAAIAVVVLMARRKGGGPEGRGLLVAAGVLAVLSAASWPRFGTFRPNGRFLMAWDLYHYYFGSRYFEELGYYDLYRCTLAADEGTGRRMLRATMVRDLRTLELASRRDLLRERPSCREQFTPERWAAFEKDLAVFYGIVPSRLWPKILQDKGYNGTPAWTRYAGALASWASAGDPWRVTAASAVDEILIVLSMLGILWAFGTRHFLLATVFFGVNYASRFLLVGGSLLRFDWLASLVLAMCAVRREKWITGGLLLAHSTMARVFPILFATGLLMRAGVAFARERRVPRRYLRFGGALVAGLAIAWAIGATGPRGTPAWGEFAENITAHSAAPASKRIGLKYVLNPIGRLEVRSAEPGAGTRALAERWESRQKIAWVLAALAFALMLVAVRRLDDVRAFALGVVPVFFLLAPTRYYWAMLVLPVAAFATPERRSEWLAIVALFAMQTIMFLADQIPANNMFTSVASSVWLLCVFSFVLWAMAWPDLRAWGSRLRTARRAGPPSP